MNRLDVTEKIISTKVFKGIKWDDVAKKVGLSKEWWTSHATVDKLKPQIEARSNASGLTPPRWL